MQWGSVSHLLQFRISVRCLQGLRTHSVALASLPFPVLGGWQFEPAQLSEDADVGSGVFSVMCFMEAAG
ncbi:hypothetical protein SAY86_000543 [Trapa natans]|uniref:Uncharacterized protein n=1 Tax=Trapa natans TaxID=22666 RepID=A0AAN7RGR2_TRANT|nr:hypothetical protein SAY86_000543 [Trapa natans]